MDYSSLIDVRIVKHDNLNTAKAVHGDKNAASGSRQLDKDKETRAAAKGTNWISTFRICFCVPDVKAQLKR